MSKYKEHLILTIFLLSTIIILIYALKWHAVYEENRMNKSIIAQYINEIKIDEFDNYINDNRDAVIYFGIVDDEICRQFENEFKKDIIEYHLQESIVYLNVKPLVGENFSQELDKNFNSDYLRNKNKFFSKVPAIGIFKDAVLIDFINGENLTPEKAIVLLKKHEIIEDIVYVND